MVYKPLSKSKLIREQTIFLLHRMIEILDEEIISEFPSIISSLFSIANEPIELEDVISLINQLLGRVKGKAFNMINEMFLPIVNQVFKYIDKGQYDQQQLVSEEVRQKVQLHKQYFVFIKEILQNECGNVLTSQSKKF